MVSYKTVLDELNKFYSQSPNSRRVLEVKIPSREFSKVMRKEGYERRSDYVDFIKSHGLDYASIFSDNDNVHILIDPDEVQDYRELQKLASMFGADILEYYGNSIVQLEGDEPDNQHHYDNPVDNGLTTMDVKRFQREWEKEHKPNSQRKTPKKGDDGTEDSDNAADGVKDGPKDGNPQSKVVRKPPKVKKVKQGNESVVLRPVKPVKPRNIRRMDEVTGACSILSKMGATLDLMDTPDTRTRPLARRRREVLKVED